MPVPLIFRVTTKGKLVLSIGIKELLDSGVHFGHQTRRWNPKMKPFIFDARNGIHIIDLSRTLAQLETACDFLTQTVRKGGKVLFVGTKKQAQHAIKEIAREFGQRAGMEVDPPLGSVEFGSADPVSIEKRHPKIVFGKSLDPAVFGVGIDDLARLSFQPT